MTEKEDEDDIINKYLPIFLSLKKEAEQDAKKSQQFEESEVVVVLSDSTDDDVDSSNEPKTIDDKESHLHFVSDDLSDSVFEQLPDFTTAPEEKEEFPSEVVFPYNSHLHKRRIQAEKRARYVVPTLFIRDILRATNWQIPSSTSKTKLICNDLYDNDILVFCAVTVRATVVGVDVKTACIIVDDGTGMLPCYLDENYFDRSKNVDISPIIKDFPVRNELLQAVTSPYAIKNGEIVQIAGNLRVYTEGKRIYVNNMVKETEVCSTREIAYIKYVKALYPTYLKWRPNY